MRLKGSGYCHACSARLKGRHSTTLYCFSCVYSGSTPATNQIRGLARQIVKIAVRMGLLPSLRDGDVGCSDCGAPASDYNHRDYMKPLDVEPVCRPCNVRRGAGRLDSTPQEARA